MNKLSLAIAVLAVSFLLGSGYIVYQNVQTLQEQSSWVTHTHEVLTRLNSLLATLTDAETGERGYIITGDERYLEPYEQALSRFAKQLQELKDFTSDNPQQQLNIKEMEPVIKERLDHLKQGIEERRNSGIEAARKTVLSGAGKAAMDRVRVMTAHMMDVETNLLARRSVKSSRAATHVYLAVGISTLVGLLLLALAVTVLKRHLQERAKREAELFNHREWLRVTLSSIGDAVIVTDTNGMVTFVNPVAEAMIGSKMEAVSGNPIQKCFNIVNEVTREPAPNPVARVLQEGIVVGLANHTALIKSDGTETPIEDSAAPIRDANGAIIGVIMVFHDVSTERKAARELAKAHAELAKANEGLEQRVRERTAELQASEERTRLMTENVLDYAIFQLDAEGRVASWNLGAKRIKGYSREEIVGLHFSKFYPAEDVAARKPQRELEEAVKNGRVEDEGWRVRKDGSRFWANVIITALRDDAGKLRGFAKVTRDLTERRRADEERIKLVQAESARSEAEAGERRVRDVLESITDGFNSFDREWRFTYANHEVERINNTSSRELIGKVLWDVFPWMVGSTVEREFKRAVQEQVPVEFEHYFDAYAKWLSVKAYPQKDGGLSVYFKDITAQKYAENELRAQTERLRVTLASIGDAVIVTDTAARVVSLNAIAQSLTGWDSEQAMTQPLDEVFNIVNEHSRDRAENPARRALREGMVVGLANHTVLVSKKGAEHPIDDSAAPIKDEQGNVLGVVLVFRDVTERKKAEDERAELLRREKAARSEAERANRMKDEFLAVVSHELRTPLTPILGWTRILKTNGASPENMSKGLEVIERNVNAQTRVIDDLLDISRIISGKLMLNVSETEVESIIETAIDTVQPAATGKQISINTHFDGSRPHVVKADANRLQQVIWNLVGNAIKFTPQNGKIDVTLRNMKSMVEIEVTDNGEGIDPNILPLLFNRFMQADSTIRRAHGGLGLGLAIVRHLVEAHGGTVSAFSEGRGRGATFKVRLPLAASVGQADTANSRPKKESIGRVLENLNLLLVEDDADSLEMIAMMLEEAGARVMRADSVAQAIQRFTERIPDAIVSDIGLPVEDGYAFIRKIRQRGKESGGGVPAIALTAFAKTEDRIHALSSGFQLHIAKPVEPAELVAAVATISGRSV